MPWWASHQLSGAEKKLQSDDVEKREAAIRDLAKLKDPRALDLIIGALHDPDIAVREAAARALGEHGDAKAATALVAALESRNTYMRKSAMESLVKIGPPAIEPLMGTLGDEFALARAEACEALGRIGDKRAIDALVKELMDPDSTVEKEAALALEALHWEPHDDEHRAELLVALQRWDDVARMGVAAVPRLIEALHEEDHDVRAQAAHALGSIKDPRVLEPLLEELHDPDSKVEKEVAAALEQLGWKPKDDYELANLLVARQKWDELEALGSAAVDRLVEALHEDAFGVRAAAARTLGQIGDLRAVEGLIGALDDELPDVRHAAEQALESFGESVLDRLVVALDDDRINVSEAAARTLAKQGRTAIGPLTARFRAPDTAPDLRQAAAGALGDLGTSAIRSFADALEDAHELVRLYSVEALGRLKPEGPEAVPIVDAMAKLLEDGNDQVRKAAVRALARIGGYQAESRLSSVYSRGGITPKQALEFLLELYDRSPDGKGFARENPGATRSTEVGERLHELGGRGLVVDVFNQFAELRPQAAGNLELWWSHLARQ
ncbi:MAG: HEAT repeat domain-containing protein [Chloroflexi bacterium]|nr:HEAT repeat domain-containing protein [Chloroflexota bacterium]